MQSKAALDQAELALARTTTYSRVDGTVEQVTLNTGVRVASVPMNPAMLIVPDRKDEFILSSNWCLLRQEFCQQRTSRAAEIAIVPASKLFVILRLMAQQ